MPDPRRLAVRRLVTDDLPPERLAHALMTEAYPEDGDLAAEVANRLRGDSRVARSAGAGRDDHAAVRRELARRHLVVAEHVGHWPELGEVLHQVVDDGEARVAHRISSAISTALNIAPAFSSVSSNSRSGFESATTPAPACTNTSPPATTRVRRVMAMSRLPPKPT